MCRLSLLVAVCLAAACGGGDERPRLLKVGALNEAIVVGFPRALDATSLTPRSLRVRDQDDRELRWRAEVRGPELLIFAVLGAEEQHAAAAGWQVSLVGFPSPHAVRWQTGGVLAQSWSQHVQPEAILRPARATPPRLLAVDGAEVSSAALYKVSARTELELAGVFDPTGLRAEAFPLRPQRGELLLDGVAPKVSARVVGERTLLRVELPAGETELVLRTRDWELHDVAGRRLDPSIVIRLSRH